MFSADSNAVGVSEVYFKYARSTLEERDSLYVAVDIPSLPAV